MARRTQSEADETRRTILSVATKLFETKGYFGTTLTEIVKATGMTKGAVFHHFESKEDLFTKIWTGLQTDMDTEARAAASAGRMQIDPYAAFLAGSRVYLSWSVRRDYQQIVLIDGPAVLGVDGWYERDSRLGGDNVRSGIRYLIKRGIIAKDREDALSILFQSILNGIGYALARDEPSASVDNLFDTFEMLLRNAR